MTCAPRSGRRAAPSPGGIAMNRGRVLHRAADITRPEGVERGEVAASVEALLCYGGLTDKLAQLLGTVNPVAGPYLTLSLPEPTEVVVIVASERPSLLVLVAPPAAALGGGSTAVVLAAPTLPLPALVPGEVLASSDLPPGATNLLTGHHREMLPTPAAHRDVYALEVSGGDELERPGSRRRRRTASPASSRSAPQSPRRTGHDGGQDGLAPGRPLRTTGPQARRIPISDGDPPRDRPADPPALHPGRR